MDNLSTTTSNEEAKKSSHLRRRGPPFYFDSHACSSEANHHILRQLAFDWSNMSAHLLSLIADAPPLPFSPNVRHASASHLYLLHNAEIPFTVSRRGRFGVCGSDFLQFEQLCQKVLLLYPSIKNAGCSRHQVSALSN